MRKILFLMYFFLTLSGYGILADTQKLADKVFNYIDNYFQSQSDVKISIAKFENTSGLSDFAAQRFYQIIVSRFEKAQKFKFKDLLIAFGKGGGEFNSQQSKDLDYFLYLRLIRDKGKLGMGIGVFSVNLKRIENIKYFEEEISQNEINILNIKKMGFEKMGFYKISEIEINENLIDISFLKGFNGSDVYLLFYPEKIDIFETRNDQLILNSTIKLNWGRPFYPVKAYEGRITLFEEQKIQYMAVGGNFSPRSKVFRLDETTFEEYRTFDFIPFELIDINDKVYIIGAEYEGGTNYFKDSLILQPFKSDDEPFKKGVKEFLAASFVKDGNKLISFYLIDRNYNLINYLSDFEEKIVFKNKVGASLAQAGNGWIVFSDYSIEKDNIYFADIKEGGFKLDYYLSLNGEIKFLSSGEWEGIKGVWANVMFKNSVSQYKLIFFGKK